MSHEHYEAFHARIEEAARESSDPSLADVVARYRRGELTQREVLVHPAFNRAMLERLREAQRSLEEDGHSMAEVRQKVGEVLAEEGLDDVLTDPESGSGPGPGKTGRG